MMNRNAMKRHVTTLLAMLLVWGGASSAFAKDALPTDDDTRAASDQKQQGSSAQNESNEDSASALTDSSNTGLDLGSGSLSADQALAHLDQARSKKSADDQESSSDEESLSTTMDNSHPCEPYPSCARADLGSKNGIDAEPFLEVAQAHNDAIQSCYDENASSDARGRVVLRFEIGSEGEAEDVTVTSSTLDADGFAECAAEQVETWSFPKPAEFGYDSLKVSHPYTFGQ